MDKKPKESRMPLARQVLRTFVFPPLIGTAIGAIVVGIGYIDAGLDSENPTAARRLYAESTVTKMYWWVSIGLVAGIAFATRQYWRSRN